MNYPHYNQITKQLTVLHALFTQSTTVRISPVFALGLESLAFQYRSELASTFHSPVTMDKIQNTLAMAAPGYDTIEAGTQL